MRTVPTRRTVMVALLLPLAACAGDGTPSEEVADRISARADDLVAAAETGDDCATQRAIDALQRALEDAQAELDPVAFEAVAVDASRFEARLDCPPPAPTSPPPAPPDVEQEDDDRGDDEDDDEGKGNGGGGPGRGQGNGRDD